VISAVGDTQGHKYGLTVYKVMKSMNAKELRNTGRHVFEIRRKWENSTILTGDMGWNRNLNYKEV
jgi:hypothetical protein